MSVELDPYGFKWGGVSVERTATLQQGYKVLTISTEHSSITIYVSPGGTKIRVFMNNGRELT